MSVQIPFLVTVCNVYLYIAAVTMVTTLTVTSHTLKQDRLLEASMPSVETSLILILPLLENFLAQLSWNLPVMAAN